MLEGSSDGLSNEIHAPINQTPPSKDQKLDDPLISMIIDTIDIAVDTVLI